MRITHNTNLQILVYWLMPGLLTICSLAVVAQPSVVTRSDDYIGKQSKSYRNIGNIGFSSFFPEPMTLPVGTCAIVDHIERINMTNEISNGTNARIMGTIALPAGRNTDKAFYADVDIPASQGYQPPQRNIPQKNYFRIYLVTLDDNLHVVTQSTPPRFMSGDAVMLQNSGLLETADCINKPAPG